MHTSLDDVSLLLPSVQCWQIIDILVFDKRWLLPRFVFCILEGLLVLQQFRISNQYRTEVLCVYERSQVLQLFGRREAP